MESYQAIYDAVRSKIGGADVGSAIKRAVSAAFDISHTRALLQEQFMIAACEMQRPSVLFRPTLSIDGNQWCALYGDDLQSGVAGLGDSPEEACRAFDVAWFAKLKAPVAVAEVEG